jgi:hypothetical protein
MPLVNYVFDDLRKLLPGSKPFLLDQINLSGYPDYGCKRNGLFPTDRLKAYRTQKGIRSDSCRIRSWIWLVINGYGNGYGSLISDRIRRYTIFHGYIRTIFDKKIRQ